MERIIYVSTARLLPSRQTVDDILAASRRNNRRDGLTGLLIVGGQRFLQVLEGPASGLDAAYTRISADPRHFAIVQLERTAIQARSFSDWQMGYAEAAVRVGGSLAELVETLTECVPEESLRAHLRGFAELHSRAA